MALARSASGPGGLSINTNSANSLFGSSTTPAAGMFGNTAASKPATGGLFGSSTTGTGTTAPQTGGLFGTASTTAQPSGGLFGATAGTSQPQTGGTGGLFGSANATTATTSAPSQTGGLFGSNTTTTSQPAAGGLFGSTAASSQPGGLFGSSTTTTTQPQQGGLFGSSTAQPAQSGGLFGGLNNQNQNKPATSSLFGGTTQNQQQNQPQQPSMFSQGQNQNQSQPQAQTSGLFGGSLSLGQNNTQNQPSVPGVRIDLSNLRGTTRFSDLHEDLQKEISRMDDIIQGQIKLKNDCEAIMPSHNNQLAQVPNDVGFCNRKLVGVESAAVSDVNAISLVREYIKTDAEHAKLSFRAIDNLKLPAQYHNTGMWSGKTQGNQSQSGEEDDAEDLVALFSKTANELAATLTKYQNNITLIEQHLRGVENTSAQQINAFVAKRTGGSSVREDPVAELAGALREFEQSIIGVAGKVGSAREGVQTLQLGGFGASTNGKNTNGKRSGVY